MNFRASYVSGKTARQILALEEEKYE